MSDQSKAELKTLNQPDDENAGLTTRQVRNTEEVTTQAITVGQLQHKLKTLDQLQAKSMTS